MLDAHIWAQLPQDILRDKIFPFLSIDTRLALGIRPGRISAQTLDTIAALPVSHPIETTYSFTHSESVIRHVRCLTPHTRYVVTRFIHYSRDRIASHVLESNDASEYAKAYFVGVCGTTLEYSEIFVCEERG